MEIVICKSETKDSFTGIYASMENGKLTFDENGHRIATVARASECYAQAWAYSLRVAMQIETGCKSILEKLKVVSDEE